METTNKTAKTCGNKPSLIIVAGIFPPDHGGPSSYVPRIAMELVEKFNVLGLIAQSPVPDFDDSQYHFPVVRVFRHQPKLLRILKTIFLIRSLGRKADVIYLNGMFLEGVIAGKLLGRPRLVSKVVGDMAWEKARVWGMIDDTLDQFQNRNYGWQIEAVRKLQSWWLRQCDEVIIPSHYLAGIVRGWGVQDKRIRVIHNAVPIPVTNPTEKKFDLVTVARLVPWKGIEALIDLSCRRGLKLKIVGDGPCRKNLEERAQNGGKEGQIVFTGSIPQFEVAGHMASSRLFVLNSHYEGLPHVVLEAMAVGTPVIATDVGGTAEAVRHGETGLLIPSGDMKALEDAVTGLLEAPNASRNLADRALKRLQADFSHSTMVERTADILMGTER